MAKRGTVKYSKDLWDPLIDDLKEFFPTVNDGKIFRLATFYFWMFFFYKHYDGKTCAEMLQERHKDPHEAPKKFSHMYESFKKEGYAYLEKLKSQPNAP